MGCLYFEILFTDYKFTNFLSNDVRNIFLNKTNRRILT